MLNHNKHKWLSKLVALTFAFNTLTPVAFAADEVTTTETQASQTVEDTATNDSNTASTTSTTTTTTNNLNTVRTNSSGQLALNSVQTDVLNRIAQSEAQAFKNKKLNITDEEISSLMNIPLSTTDDTEYYTQEEKDYNNLQLLIARGLNTKEKRDEALQKLQAIEELSKTDSSVGLTNTEKYVKSLLENYNDIESRAGSNGALGSAITPTDSSIIAYKTILKVAKAERQACRNDAVKNGTDPNECKLSERGQEAAQILTYLTNQQINQTTDSKKTTDATNSTANSTSTTGSNEARTCSDTTKRPAINNIYKCCPTDKPYINTSTGKCDTKTQNPTSDDDDDDDDDNNGLLNALLLGNGSGNSYDPEKPGGICPGCKTTNDKGLGTDKNATGNDANNIYNRTNKKTTVSKGRATPSFMQRIGNVNIEFQDYNPVQGTSTPVKNVEYINKEPVFVHIADPNTEFQIKVKVNENANSSGENKKEEKPIYVNLFSYNFLTTVSGGEQTIAFKNFQPNKGVNSFIPVLFSEQQTYEGYHFKKVNREQPYPVYIEITDGTNKVNYTVWYKVYNLGTTIGEQTKNTSGEANEIEILPNDSEELDATSMNIQGKLQDASWNGDRCVLSVSGKYYSNDSKEDIYDFDSDVSYEQINQDDCNKLGDKARTGNIEITLPDTSAYFSADGTDLDLVANTSLNPVLKDMDTNEYMSQEQFNSEFQSTSNFQGKNNIEIPFSTTQDGYQVMYNPATNAFTKYTDNGWEPMSNQEFSNSFLNGQTIPEGTPLSIGINKDKAVITVNGHEVDTDIITKKFYRGAHAFLGESGITSYFSNVADGFNRVLQNSPSMKVIQGVIGSDSSTKVNRQDNSLTTVNNPTKETVNSTMKANKEVESVIGIPVAGTVAEEGLRPFRRTEQNYGHSEEYNTIQYNTVQKFANDIGIDPSHLELVETQDGKKEYKITNKEDIEKYQKWRRNNRRN